MRCFNAVLLLVALSTTAFATKGNKGNNNNSGGYGYGGGYGRGMMQQGMRNNFNGYYPTMQQGHYGGYPMQNQYSNQGQYYGNPVQGQYYGNPVQSQYYGNPVQGQYYGNPMLQQQNYGVYNGYQMNQGVYGNQFAVAPSLGGSQWVNNGIQGNLFGQQLAMQSNFAQPMYQSTYLGQGINTAGSGIAPTFTDLSGNNYGQTVFI